MRNRIWSGTCAAITLGLIAGLAAQTPQQPPPTTPQTSSQTTTKDAKNITVTGCLQKAADAVGTTGSTSTSRASDATFVLKSATMGATGTSGTAGAPSSASTANEYRLDADDAKLTPHVGHKVEIMGTVEQTSSTSSVTTPAGQTASASASTAPKLKVDSVKMIAATCP